MPPPIRRPQNLFIHSQFTFFKSRKNNHKHLKTLCIETTSYRSYDFRIPPKALLKTLKCKVKCLKTLNLGKHQLFFDLKPTQALRFIKSFPHIQSLTLIEDPYRYFSNKSYLKWLTQSKHLIHLAFGPLPVFCGFFRAYRSSDRPDNFSLNKTTQAKYKKTLKHLRLLSLSLHSYEAIFCHSDRPHPISLKKLSMSAPMLLSSFSLDLSHLPNLSILDLYFPIAFDNLLNILHSLPNPHKLTQIKFYIANVPDQANQHVLKLPESINYFHSLHSIHIVINSFLFVSALLKSLANPENLHHLTLNFPIQDQEQLKELTFLIGNFPNLSHLAIKNQKFVQDYADEGYKEFFHQVSRQARLKSLEINLCERENDPLQSEIFYGCMGKFANCLEKLQELHEINFTQSEWCLQDELDFLAKALKKKGSKLRKLTIEFANKNRKVDHIGIFNGAFAQMKNLEDLHLESAWARKESLQKFCEIVSELNYLRYLYLDLENRAVDQETFPRHVREVLMKYGLEELHWSVRECEEVENFEEADPIDMKEVVLRNPQFYTITLSGPTLNCISWKNEKAVIP